MKISDIEESNFYKIPKSIYELDLNSIDREVYMLCNIGNKEFIEKYILVHVPAKLAKGIYTDEEIKKEIEDHINPKTNSDYKNKH